MKSKRLFAAFGGIDDKYISEEAEERRGISTRWVAIAASLVLAIGIGSFVLLNQSGTNYLPGGNSGGSGSSGSSVFMSYAGPVLPLTLTESVNGITVSRNISYDFSDVRISDIRISDEYILTNNTSGEIRANVLYPFVGNFRELDTLLPTLKIGGVILDAGLYAGQYSGGFTGAWGGDNPNSTLNLQPIKTWEGYNKLLSDGQYMTAALADIPLLDQTVIVYEFKNVVAAPNNAVAPTLAARFNLDYDKTIVLSNNFNGGEFDRENDTMRRSYFIPDENSSRAGETYCLIVIGEDITDFNIQGYQNGGCHKGEEIDVTADVMRYEAALGDIIWQLLNEFYDTSYDYPDGSPYMDMLYRAVAELLYSYGALSKNAANRYDTGFLEDIFSEAGNHERVFYLSAEVVITAGESVVLGADFIKQGSYDFYGSGSGYMGVYGYDMMTRLGSNLEINTTNAGLLNASGIEIVRQNFGFDLDNGVTEVMLDMTFEHYYLEVRSIPRDNE